MANNILAVQIAYPAGNKSPIVGGSTPNAANQRLSFYNIGRLLLGMLVGVKFRLGAAYLQYQSGVVAASATATCATVTTGQTVTIAGTALTAAQKRASATATCATVLANTTITVNGQVFTGTAGAVTLGDPTFSIDTGNTETATSLAAQINAYGGSKVSGIVKAKSASAVVTIYAVTQGTAGNAITLTSSDGGTLAVTGSGVLANGAALTNNTFDFVGTNATTADALAAAINASTTAAIKQVTALSDGVSVVTITSKVGGIAGNGITLTSSDGATLAVTGSGFLASGAADAAVRLTV